MTGPEDGVLLNRGYSYWPQAWMLDDNLLYVFCGHADEHVRFFRVDVHTGSVLRLGSLIPYTGTGEGWSWDRHGRMLLIDGPRLRRVDPFTGEDEILCDISALYPDCDLWQAHSSDDGTVHSATLRRITDSGAYEKIATVVYRNGWLPPFTARGVLDESQIDHTGRYLLIKEDDDNRIIDLETGDETRLVNEDGALGHSDMGDGFAVGEDDRIGGCVWMNLANPIADRHLLYPTWNMGHIAVRGDTCVVADATRINRVALDRSGISPLIEHGMVVPPNTPKEELYNYQVFPNLDHTGRVVTYMSNAAGRMDLYLCVLPLTKGDT